MYSMAKHHFNNDQWLEQLRNWSQTLPGELLLNAELNQLDQILPKLFGYYAIQVRSFWPADLLSSSLIPLKVIVEKHKIEPFPVNILGESSELPIKSDSVDLVLLPHVLEFEQEPHEVLREAERVLIPEGNIVILGFNPLSLWGLWRMLSRLRRRPPWNGHFIGVPRIKDWLSLLGFEVCEKKVFFFRPPIRREKVMNRLVFMEKYCGKVIPSFGSVYMIHAKKRVMNYTPIKPRWRQRRLVTVPPVAEG